MEVELRHLWTFIAVAEEANFTALRSDSTSRNKRSPATFATSRQRSTARLFERTTHFVELTEAGSGFLERIVPALNLLDSAVAAVRTPPTDLHGVLRIAFTPATSRDVVPRLVEDFQVQYPAITIEATQLWGEEIVEALDTGTADIGVALEPTESARFHRVELHAGELGLVLTADHVLAQHEAIELHDLEGWPIVVPGRGASPGLFDKFVNACHLAGFRPELQMKARMFGASAPAVLRGEALSPYPSCMSLKYVTDGLVYRSLVNPTIPLSVALLTLRDQDSVIVDRLLAIAEVQAAT